MGGPRLGIIIPAYNEEATIGKVVQASSSLGEVIVVNDCSTDKTAEVAKQAGAIVVTHKNNKGYDGALNSGFLKAQEIGVDIAITLDADGQHDPTKVEEFVKAFKSDPDLCLVIGVRPEKARISEMVMGVYFKSRFGINDPLCGMKAYHLKRIGPIVSFDRYNSIGTDLTFRVAKNGLKFIQIPIPISDRLDQPRFGSIFRANKRIMVALGKTMFKDFLGDTAF